MDRNDRAFCFFIIWLVTAFFIVAIIRNDVGLIPYFTFTTIGGLGFKLSHWEGEIDG